MHDPMAKNRRGSEYIHVHNTDPAPFVFCEFCKSMQTHGNAPQEPEKQAWCEVRRRVLYKICKKVYFARARRAGAMRGPL